jgi:GTP-binding protein YchF
MVTVEKRLANVKSKMKSGKTKDLEKEESAVKKIFDVLENGKMANTADLTDDEKIAIKEMSLLTNKPILYVVNVGEDSASNKNWSSPLGDNRTALPISIKVESEIMEMSKEDQNEFLNELGFEQSGLDRLISNCYTLLNLITYFTSGEVETRAWTVSKGTKAPQAAGVIHTDFEKAFIRAEVISATDFIELNGESGARDAGKQRIEGKEYVVQDGDVCHFRVGV